LLHHRCYFLHSVAEIEVNGTPFEVEIQKAEKDPQLSIKQAGKVEPLTTVPEKNVFGCPIKAPLPGNIVKIMVTEGQLVKRSDVLLIMESMKMENNILATEDGVVKKIHVQVGQTVMQDDTLIDFEGHLDI
jgi:biotin carboxyl carrier protein